MKFEALRFEHTDRERALLHRLLALPPDQTRRAVKALDDADLYEVQRMVGTAYDRADERDVALRRTVDEVVRFRFPRGWPSPGSSIPAESDAGA